MSTNRSGNRSGRIGCVADRQLGSSLVSARQETCRHIAVACAGHHPQGPVEEDPQKNGIAVERTTGTTRGGFDLWIPAMLVLGLSMNRIGSISILGRFRQSFQRAGDAGELDRLPHHAGSFHQCLQSTGPAPFLGESSRWRNCSRSVTRMPGRCHPPPLSRNDRASPLRCVRQARRPVACGTRAKQRKRS